MNKRAEAEKLVREYLGAEQIKDRLRIERNIARAEKSCATLTALVEKGLEAQELTAWLFNSAELFGWQFGEYDASLDEANQVIEIRCYGCAAQGTKKWPKWESNFAHESDCRYLALKALAAPPEAAAGKEKP